MKTEQIALVLAISREQSISEAAKSLFISQPTASNMLKALEEELGYSLFVRSKAGIQPTDEGTEFLEYARTIERSVKAISQIRKPVRRIEFKVLSHKYDFTELAFERLCEKYLTRDYAVDLGYHVLTNTDQAARMLENGSGDIAVMLCRKKLYESQRNLAAKRQLVTKAIGEFSLEVTCNRGHPLIEGGTIRRELFGKYPLFCSIDIPDVDMYTSVDLARYGIEIQNSVIMDRVDARFRLLQKTGGYLVSTPVPASVKATYGLGSLPFEDSDLIVFAMFRKSSQKEALINEYIRSCMKYLTLLKEKRSMTDAEYILHSDQG